MSYYIKNYVGVALIVIALFVFFSLGEEKNPSVITIKTEVLPTLSPHEHEIGLDSITDDGHHAEISSRAFVIPQDVWIQEISFEIINAPALVLHHLILSYPEKPNKSCLWLSKDKTLLAISQDQIYSSSYIFPEGYGIPLKKGTHLTLCAMFHNPIPPLGPGGTYKNVYAEINFKVSNNEILKEVTPYFLSLSDNRNPEVAIFSVPPHSKNYTFIARDKNKETSEITFNEKTSLLYWSAHVHGWEGGKSLTAYKNDLPIHTFTTRLSTSTPYRYDTPHFPTRIVFEKGDTLSIQATYDNPTDEVLRGAMGILGIFMTTEE